MKNLIWFVFAGTRGGETRARIVSSLLSKPKNSNQISKDLKLDYKTVQHHLKVLTKNKLLDVQNKNNYGAVFFPSTILKENLSTFKEIWERFGKN